MLGGNSKKIPFVVEKALLEAVEKTHKSRDDIVLVDICDTIPDIFGAAGSTLRRDLQEHWKNLKRRSIRAARFSIPHNKIAELPVGSWRKLNRKKVAVGRRRRGNMPQNLH